MRSTTHLLGICFFSFFSIFSSPRVRICGVHPNSLSNALTSSKSYPLSRHMLRGVPGFVAPSGSSVSLSILKSFLFAPATGQESGIPFLSVVKLRFVPILALSVGFFPIFFPAKRRFRHSSVRTAETPINAFYFLIPFKVVFPHFLEYSFFHPFLKSSMSRT